MSYLNKCEFIGRLTSNPDVKRLNNGDTVANVRLAVNEPYRKDGERLETNEYIPLVFWKHHAENAANLLKSGALIYVEARHKTNQYEKDGIQRESIKYEVSAFRILAWPKDSASYEPEH